MARFAATINVSSATLSTSDGSAGILKKMTEPEDVDDVSFGYTSPNDSINVGELLLFDLHSHFKE